MTTPERIGRYEILEEIASGFQATVYRARDRSLNRVVALKVMHANMVRDPEFVRRFLQEARMAASLTHSNVVFIHEVGEDAGSHYIAMEYLPTSLHDVLEKRGTLPVEEAVEIMRQVTNAIRAAHEQGIVHRDLKPHNILLTEDGISKVTDFGIARAAEFGTMTATGTVLGTPQYMSPDQFRDFRGVDIRSDLYSLGIVLFKMLTGRTPLQGKTNEEIRHYHWERHDIPLEYLRPLHLRPSLFELIKRLLEKDSEARYGTPEELLKALAQLETASNVVTPKVSSPPTTQVKPPRQPSQKDNAMRTLSRTELGQQLEDFGIEWDSRRTQRDEEKLLQRGREVLIKLLQRRSGWSKEVASTFAADLRTREEMAEALRVSNYPNDPPDDPPEDPMEAIQKLRLRNEIARSARPVKATPTEPDTSSPTTPSAALLSRAEPTSRQSQPKDKPSWLDRLLPGDPEHRRMDRELALLSREASEHGRAAAAAGREASALKRQARRIRRGALSRAEFKSATIDQKLVSLLKLHLSITLIAGTMVPPILVALWALAEPGLLQTPTQYPESVLGVPSGLGLVGMITLFVIVPLQMFFARRLWPTGRAGQVLGARLTSLYAIWFISTLVGLLLASLVADGVDPNEETWRVWLAAIIASPLSAAAAFGAFLDYPIGIVDVVFRRGTVSE